MASAFFTRSLATPVVDVASNNWTETPDGTFSDSGGSGYDTLGFIFSPVASLTIAAVDVHYAAASPGNGTIYIANRNTPTVPITSAESLVTPGAGIHRITFDVPVTLDPAINYILAFTGDLGNGQGFYLSPQVSVNLDNATDHIYGAAWESTLAGYSGRWRFYN